MFSARRALWRLDALRGGTPERLAFVGQDGQSPVIARTADGKQRLVYVRTVSDSNVWRLTTSAPGVPASTAPVQAVASTRDDFTPGLSPDGRRVAFWSNRSGEPQIWIADIDGSHERQVTSMAFRSFPGWPRWSPDGRLIAFQGDPQDRPDVLVVPAEGGPARIVTAHLFSSAFPSFSRDGRSLYVCRWDGPETRVWKIPVSRRAARSHHTRSRHFFPSSRRWPGPLLCLRGRPAECALAHVTRWWNTGQGARRCAVWQFRCRRRWHLLPRTRKWQPTRILTERCLPLTAAKHGSSTSTSRPRRSTTIAPNLGMVGHGLTWPGMVAAIFFARIDSMIDELMLVDDFR